MTYADWLERRKAGGYGGRVRRADEEEGDLDEVAAGQADDQSESRPGGETEKPESDPCRLPGVEYFQAGNGFSVGDIAVSSFTIPHDAADPVGFVFEVEGIRVGLATDLGYVPPNVQQRLKGCDVLMIESNHDLEMLRDGPYPWSVKQRVMSRVGHLSNDAAAGFLEKNYDGRSDLRRAGASF